MSTTFDVYPGALTIPTFEEVLSLGTENFHKFLASQQITARPKLEVRLFQKRGDTPIPLDLTSPATWSEEHYAWFHVAGVLERGTDVYFGQNSDFDENFKHEEIQTQENLLGTAQVQACLSVRHHWWFRRRAGASGTVSLLFGILAASVAKLTNGLVHSSDGAWDISMLPATPDDFLSFYFLPKYAGAEREWVRERLDSLAKELASQPSHSNAYSS